ncbi:MAG: 50S ribosomal protein L13 [Candidatus Magasanikbacteria bacterium RIFCSPHIGHO2_01_FULL_33_34]|uniref:Large ribosomal subunit protein uL13 n=1 Tax=Candidatus Magasanikbacteria bacterium RIFCSPHIGHO2_01_FULL_33_34 TaxID=1798671 RepID=A0A1F6LLH6_9BACT|nr:MAG: 50S ribosomal protein L13 [Candidatus Magasanikbacteria bacterium RIFCSPHIGHO2_01_FULL_33_34]OGH65866.1 MAG: 50S ribosomal protein L13 [Candidatus Magasanikbacteria bacterium RIFCSPHIGHO2_02_FULL_33_17]OGH75412.1 MAG: 50S ribosomal protein L13 [Candidatus Magasanikbacteria bacterium RIFCSPLOWO2_01_FULL_33_34]OGH82538.1 MAG: 50S ribosomal protein L13 [Candidatus Magasanikbacteria bacterium RIFCSPLOWO2_12_FULL_34_7]
MKRKKQVANIVVRAVHEIDAAGRAPGRVATEVAMILRGKNKADFSPHIDNGDNVVVLNTSKLKFTGKKLVQKDYRYHTLYPGGLKKTSMKKVFENNPTDVIKKAVYGMLPKNRLREEMMKRLTIKA